MFWKKKTLCKNYDHKNLKPVIRCSICTGEQTAGFQNIHTGKFEEVMLIRTDKDVERFREIYGIEDQKIEKVY